MRDRREPQRARSRPLSPPRRRAPRAPLVCVVARQLRRLCARAARSAPRLLALATPWPLLAFTALSASAFSCAQLVVFAVGLARSRLRRRRAVALASRARRRSALPSRRGRAIRAARTRSTRRSAMARCSMSRSPNATRASSPTRGCDDRRRRRGAALIDELLRGAARRRRRRRRCRRAAAAHAAICWRQAFPATPGASGPRCQRFHLL